jgi:hypothetical protein
VHQPADLGVPIACGGVAVYPVTLLSATLTALS